MKDSKNVRLSALFGQACLLRVLATSILEAYKRAKRTAGISAAPMTYNVVHKDLDKIQQRQPSLHNFNL